jgi:hypothetical protein
MTDPGIDLEHEFSVMKHLYDGYKFYHNVESAIFNSGMVLYYLDKYVDSNEPPMDLLDSNVISDYAKVLNLVSINIGDSPNSTNAQIAYSKEKRQQLLNSIIISKAQETQLTQLFSLAIFTDDNFLSLLFYMGYLTIDSFRRPMTKLVIPNIAFDSIFTNYFDNIVLRPALLMRDEKRIKAVEELAFEGKTDLLAELMTEVLRSMSTRVSIDFNESSLRGIAFCITHEYSGYISSTEESTEDGYIDLALIPNEPKVRHCHIIEFKYVLKGAYSQGAAHGAWRRGLEEIRRYASSVKFNALADRLKVKSIKKWIIIYSGYESMLDTNF